MLILFDNSRRAKQGTCKPTAHPLAKSSTDWKDGTYLVGVLDGNVVGAVAVVNEMFVVDLTDTKEVLAMVRDRMPAGVREALKRELLTEFEVPEISPELFTGTEASA